jgi:hypothetical protein
MPEITISLPDGMVWYILGLITLKLIWNEIRYWRGKK